MLQFSVALRTARAGAIEPTIGTAPTIEIRTGAPPANCAAADSGTLLGEIDAPSDWLAAAAAGAVSMTGDWEEVLGVAAGVAGHFRLKQGGTCHMQGTCGAAESGADMELSNTNIAVDQPIDVLSFTITEGNQ